MPRKRKSAGCLITKAQGFDLQMTVPPLVRNYFGAVMMAAFGAIAIWRWSESGSYFFALLSLRDLLAAKFFISRPDAEKSDGFFLSALAYFSSALPLFYSAVSDVSRFQLLAGEALIILGFLLVTLATIELADRFGIAPAKRGDRCTSGVYGYLSHPMYMGYFTAELGLVLLAPQNTALFVLSTSLYALRASRETTVLRED